MRTKYTDLRNPDMIEKPRGFQIRRFCVRPGRSVQQKMNLMQETLLLVEQLFTDLL